MDKKDVLKRFRHIKVITIEQLVDLLQSSVITARRRLKKWKTYTSFNNNGRYYTLPDIPDFDRNGIWKYQRILFSRYGNLKQTIMQLVKQSKAGLSAREIADIVELPSNSSFFSQLHNFAGIRREKHQGRYIYFSDIPVLYENQKQAFTLYREGEYILPSEAEAVVILVQLIKHPDISSIEELSDRVAQEGKKIEPCVIKSFLESHDLLKKIPDTKS
jgi:hypothetical protein